MGAGHGTRITAAAPAVRNDADAIPASVQSPPLEVVKS